ncbi:MAG: DUF167 domain-containing protein, partial [Chloroflexi bacterium]
CWSQSEYTREHRTSSPLGRTAGWSCGSTHRLSGGAANRAVLAAVAGHFDLPVSSVRLRSGARSRTKLVEVDSVVEAGSED